MLDIIAITYRWVLLYSAREMSWRAAADMLQSTQSTRSSSVARDKYNEYTRPFPVLIYAQYIIKHSPLEPIIGIRC